jgi:isochorismate synthase
MNRIGTLTTTVTRDRLAALCRRGTEQAAGLGHPVLVSLTIPYHGESGPLELFGRAGGPSVHRSLWLRPEQDFWLVGHGRAVELTAATECPVTTVKQRHRELLAEAVIEAPDAAGTGPVFFGGFRYDPQMPPDPVWRGFPDARFTLPQLLFARSDGSTWLTVNALVSPTDDVASLVESVLQDLKRLEAGPSENHAQPPLLEVREDSRHEWRRRVATALGAIKDGTISKVVLSRRRELHASGAFSPEAGLAYLAETYPSCAVFAADDGGAVFLGASPEGMASVADGRLTVTCLASSAPRGSTPDEDAKYRHYLLASRKERREHAAVTGMLAEALRDVCRELRWPDEPRIMQLKNIQHLYTPFTGLLRPGVNLLDIVRRLHPTPAVGGVPTEPALELIREIEGDRGWYAAPVGWFDRAGNGDFIVAIRSALLRDDTAFLYAGCGIITGSQAEREYRETELKFQPLLAALAPER